MNQNQFPQLSEADESNQPSMTVRRASESLGNAVGSNSINQSSEQQNVTYPPYPYDNSLSNADIRRLVASTQNPGLFSGRGRIELEHSSRVHQQQSIPNDCSSSSDNSSSYTPPFIDNSVVEGVERVGRVLIDHGSKKYVGPNQKQPPNNDLCDQRQTTNFRHQYFSPQPPQDHHRQYQFHQMNNHVASELLSAANNDNINSRQQLNNSSLPYASAAATDYDLHLIANEMKNVYESDNQNTFDAFHHNQMQGPAHDTRYPSPQPIDNPYIQQQQHVQHDQQQPAQTQPQQQQPQGNNTLLEEGQTDNKSESDGGSPGRTKAISKPERPVTKSATGQYVCEWENCLEEVKIFTRKCEWSKHMDKHDRPYKCQANGCEKLPGFTYSGGLLRHEREVHNKHGGPRKQLNCPHVNCKRHGGKGFSRQENLNEHLRRVHTTTTPTPNGNPPNGAEAEPAINPEQAQEQEIEAQLGAQLGAELGQVPGQGQKRKRVHLNDDADDEIRDEIKRLQQENHDLREELQRTKTDQEAIQADMQRQLHHLQAAIHMQTQPRMQQSQPRVQQAPPANMV